MLNSRWGNVTVKREKKPQVEVSFNRGDEEAMRMIARWFDMTYEEFLKIVPPRLDDLVLVHADGGDCHGTPLVNWICPKCGISPDMQSTELWPKSEVKT